MNRHVILIGFKHVGKSAIGQALAKKIQRPFLDLDKMIMQQYETQFNKQLNCRQIMQEHGETFFRELETKVLSSTLNSPASILSLGGGSALHEDNQKMLANHIVIHITAPRGIVFERILMSGRPEFFDPNENILDSFNRLWDEREPIYKKIKQFAVDNNGSIDEVVEKIVNVINVG